METEETLLLKRKLERERQARKEAERILEIKALELYTANINLLNLNQELENQVLNKTEDLEKSKAIYKELVEATNEIVYEIDEKFQLVYINQAASKLLQYTQEEFYSITFLDLIEKSEIAKINDYIINCLKNKITNGYLEFAALKKNGEIVWLGQNFQMVFENVNNVKVFKGMKAMVRDITAIYNAQLEIKINEEKYRLIMENMNLGFMEVNQQGIITKVYQALCDMTGYTEDELIGKSAEEKLLPEEYKNFMHNQSLLRAKGQISAYEIELQKKNGQRLWVLVSGGPIFNQKREIIGSVGIHYDISNLKKIQSELAEAKEIAESSQQAEQEFLANMSHEIRTPLNAVIGMSHLLYDTNPTNEQIEYLDIIKNSANFLHALISDILDMAKIEARKIEIKAVEFDLIGVLKTLHKTYQLKTQNKKLLIILNIDPKLDVLVIGDQLIFNQILNNLLSNAEKFTEEGFIKISVEIIEFITDKKVIMKFSVEDTGQGMDATLSNTIFQKFTQVHDKNTSKTKGTGLGLAIVKELIELQGGTIGVKTIINQGTTFFFDLPFELTQKKVVENIEKEFDENISKLSDFNILIAEDNQMNFKYLSTLLNKWNIRYKHALDGLEAIAIAKNQKFDLVLMDIQMPSVNGYEATIAIRSEFGPNQKIPIIALTASAMVIERDKAKNAGMNEVLIKPFTPDQLKTVLNNYLNKNTQIIKTPDQPMFTCDSELNQTSLHEYFGEDKDFKKIVFESFLEEIEAQIQELQLHFGQQNWLEVASLTHKMKPSFAMVGLSKTETVLKGIESTIKTTGINNQIINDLAAFLNDFPALLLMVKNEFKNISI